MPNGFYIGPVFVHFYGILITLGAVVAAWLATVEAKRRKIDPELVWDMFIPLLVAGIIGARIWHIFTPSQSLVEQGITTWFYLTHPLEAINIRNGGLGIPGAVIGGALALYLFTKKKKLNFWTWTDIIAPGLALAQAIGRLGNYFNQEVYGSPTDLPWAITIDKPYRLPEYMDQATYHPLFAYEMIYNLINMGVLLWLGRKYEDRLKPGDIFLVYLIIYPVGRFFLEFLRLDPSPVAGLNINQTFMGLTAIGAAAALIYRHVKKSPKIVETGTRRRRR